MLPSTAREAGPPLLVLDCVAVLPSATFVTGRVPVEVSVTVKLAGIVPASPSVTVASQIDARTAGPSLAAIVPVAVSPAITPLTGLERTTLNVSASSCTVSPMMGTAIVAVVCPGPNVSVPLVAW